MSVTRCRLPALQAAARLPMERDAFAGWIARQPEVCPHADCSPGATCRDQVAEVLRAVWVQRRKQS